MSQQESSSAEQQVLQVQRQRQVPIFEPIDGDDARARAAVEQWRTFTMLLEPQPGSPEASSVCDQIAKLAVGGQEGECDRTRFTILTKESLTEMAKQNGISGKRALAQALVWRMARDREEGLALKKNKAIQNNDNFDLRDMGNGSMLNGGDQAFEVGGMEQTAQDDGDGKVVAGGGTDDSENKQGDEDEEEDQEAVVRKQMERERAKLELRAARLFTTTDDDLGAPDRVYILKGFPATETDAAQFLEENNAYYTASSKKSKSSAPLPVKPEDKPAFLSSLDAVVQLTTKELIRVAEAPPRASSGRTDSRPGTASSRGSARSPRSARDDQPISPGGRGRETEEAMLTRKEESVWDRLRTANAPNPFVQASGVAKALAVAQTKGGTVWQDLSFCYINIIAPPAPNMNEAIARPSSPERKAEKTSTKGAPKIIGEVKDILELAGEFKEMVTQIAFEKFDFHQWFSTAEMVTIPRKDKGIDIARAVAEAQRAGMGPLAGSSGADGSAARVKGSLWATDPALLAYSDLMLAVPDEINSVATAVHFMVEAVMLECTGATPHPLDTSPPAALAPPTHDQGAPVAPPPVVTGINKKAAARVAPLSDGCVGNVPLGDHLDERKQKLADGSRTEGTDVSSLASTGSHIPRPLARNVVIEFGDIVGERATRAALNRAAAFGEGRIDPRAVVAVEREAIAKLQNPRLVGQGALPREPGQNEKDRGTEQCELLTFTDLGKKDVDRTRQVWSFEHLLNARHPPPGQGEAWSFENRRYWDVLPQHVVQQVLRAENGTEPLVLRQYYPPTDELLVALHHDSPPGRARICSWDPCTSGSIPPSFKEWASMVIPKDSSYTPRTLLALGALMDVSKADLDRAKTKSIKVFPADHSLVVLSGFVATSERWLSVFKDGHVMGLRLTDTSAKASSWSGMGDSHGGDTKGASTKQKQFPTEFIMSFDDDSRIVVKEGQPPPPRTSSRPASSKEARKSTANRAAAAPPSPSSLNGGRKPNAWGTVACVHTFPTGLVVSTGSDGTVGMKFVLDSKRGRSGNVLEGFIPEAAKDEFARAVVGRGTVVRYMRDGSTQMLFVTGDVVTRKGGETILTDKHGRCFRKTDISPPAGTDVTTPAPSAKGKASNASGAAPHPDVGDMLPKEWVRIQSPSSATKNRSGGNSTANKVKQGGRTGHKAGGGLDAPNNDGEGTPVRDVETGALVWGSHGGEKRVFVSYEDELTVTRHTDGTVQRWWRGEGDARGSTAAGLVLVECPGFASVEVDVEIQEMCSKHSNGKPVTITRGGNRVRLRAVMPNGGVTLVTYDTRVTSQVCGRVIYVHSDNTEVIANDKGEVVVRPRGMWEGRPVHGILAGPNSSMPPNCAQPDLLIGTYKFDCLKGEMESEDTDRNRFLLDLTKTAFLREGFSISRVGGSTANGANSPAEGSRRPSSRGSSRASSRPSSGKSDGVTIDLAGETIGVRSDALVNDPLEPRLFVYHRDGSALELLRNDDSQKWLERLSHNSPCQPNQQRFGEGVDRRSGEGAASAVDVREQECLSDPHSQGSRQLGFYVPVLPMPRGEGSFAALLRERRGQVFGDGYDHSGGDSARDDETTANLNWRTRPLPLAARTNLGADIGIPARGCSTAMEACIRRVWLEHPPLPTKALEELRMSLAGWEAWKQCRAEQIGRFLVSDPRPDVEVEAQHAVQKLIRKAFREAKAAKQKAKEKARAARAQAAKKKVGPSGTRGGTGGTTSTVSLEELSTVASTFGEAGLLDSEEHEDGDLDDVDFPDSEEEEEDEETALLRQEAASAFASAGGSAESQLNIPALRLAMIMVLGRAVKESEAESRLHALRERNVPRQPHGRQIEGQSDPAKASQNDLFHILLGVRAAPPSEQGAPLPPHDEAVAENEATDQHASPPGGTFYELVAPVFSSNASSPSTAIGHTRLKPPPTPRGFWDTPVGCGLEGSSAVGWKKGGCSHDVVSQGQVDSSNPAEQESAKRDDKNSSSSGPGVGVDIDVDVDAGVDSSDLDRTSGGLLVTPAGEKGQGNDNNELMSGDIHVRAGIIPEELRSEELELEPHHSSLPKPSLHAVASSTATTSRPSGPGLLGAGADAENGTQNSNRTGETSGGHPATVSVNAPNGGEIPTGAEGVAEEQMTAHGTGTRAVRSLSRGGGSGGAGASIEMKGEAQAIFESEALSSTHMTTSCAFEVAPTSVSLGVIGVGCSVPVKIQVTNVGGRPARFRVDSYPQHVNDNNNVGQRCVTVARYTRGRVAAGLAVVVSLEVLAHHEGAVREVVRVVAEDGIAEVIITGEAFEGRATPETVATIS